VTRELDTSIAIRTAVVLEGRIYFSAGGGIVADSDPGQEYLETLDKARALIDALAPDS
jgi:anthranilate/para-aminobenzoate synthase component I